MEDKLKYLNTVPTLVLLNCIIDYTSNEKSMHASTFILACQPLFRKIEPLELFDLCIIILRERAALFMETK